MRNLVECFLVVSVNRIYHFDHLFRELCAACLCDSRAVCLAAYCRISSIPQFVHLHYRICRWHILNILCLFILFTVKGEMGQWLTVSYKHHFGSPDTSPNCFGDPSYSHDYGFPAERKTRSTYLSITIFCFFVSSCTRYSFTVLFSKSGIRT